MIPLIINSCSNVPEGSAQHSRRVGQLRLAPCCWESSLTILSIQHNSQGLTKGSPKPSFSLRLPRFLLTSHSWQLQWFTAGIPKIYQLRSWSLSTVLSHRETKSSLEILQARTDGWKGLFRRSLGYFHTHDFFCALAIAVLILLTPMFVLAPNFFLYKPLFLHINTHIHITAALKDILRPLTCEDAQNGSSNTHIKYYSGQAVPYSKY